MMEYPKRLIEVDLPIKVISEHARREKSIRHGHIASLHIWWARRPLAACRAITCAALWPDPVDEKCSDAFRSAAARLMRYWAKEHLVACSADSYGRFNRIAQEDDLLADTREIRLALLDFIGDFADWDNASDPKYLMVARSLTAASASHSCGDGAFKLPATLSTNTLRNALDAAPRRPMLIDPFAGGGAIPLEGARCGADVFATDLNPVAVLLNKVVLEYLPIYGEALAEDVEKWGQWVRAEAGKALEQFYPRDNDGASPITYLWARKVTCEGPGCGAEVPLIRNLWLSKRSSNACALKLVPRPRAKRVDVEIVRDVKGGSVGRGTVARGSVTCPCCGYTMKTDSVRKQLQPRHGGADDAFLLAVVTTYEGESGRLYRLPNERDLAAVLAARRELGVLTKGEPDPGLVPDEPYPDETAAGALSSSVLYGLSTWGDLFTSRQALSLATLAKLTRDAPIGDGGRATAVRVLLAFVVDKLADLGNSMCAWEPNAQCPRHLFGRQAIPMTWDFAEGVPLSDSSGGYNVLLRGTLGALRTIGGDWGAGQAERAPAQANPLPDGSASCVFTDPPYYDAIAYGDLSDFFYVWLRRMLGKDLPSLFDDTLVDKTLETVQLSERFSGPYAHKTKQYFEAGMTDALREGRRVVTPDGIAVVVFAHKSTSGWEAQLRAMIDAGWIVTGSWPIDTECSSRMNAMGAATLASSVHLACRPREDEGGRTVSVKFSQIGDWRDVLAELPKRINLWLPRLAAEGVVGADAIFACLGPALEIFSRYSAVEKTSGEKVELREYLEQVWAEVAKQALNMIFEGADTAGLQEDARLTAMWLWTLRTDAEAHVEAGEKVERIAGYSLEYDAARKIAQGLGCHLENLAHLVEIKGENATLLSAASRARYLFGKEDVDVPKKRRKKNAAQGDLFAELDLPSDEDLSREQAELERPAAGNTVLDQLHQSMILFGAGRGAALKRFLVDDGVGANAQLWSLAQSLSALYPPQSEEKRWVDGVLARKKGLGF